MDPDKAFQICVLDPRFVSVHLIPESDNPEDDKVYLFFRENAIDGEHAGKATHARIGQLCKVHTHICARLQTHAQLLYLEKHLMSV